MTKKLTYSNLEDMDTSYEIDKIFVYLEIKSRNLYGDEYGQKEKQEVYD